MVAVADPETRLDSNTWTLNDLARLADPPNDRERPSRRELVLHPANRVISPWSTDKLRKKLILPLTG